MAPKFKTKSIGLLFRQLTFSPVKVRKNVIFQTEKFLPTVAADKEYPYDYIVHKLTGHRPETPCDDLLTGEVLANDLNEFMAELADTVDISPEEISEPVMDVNEIAGMFNVSAKTIYRWNRSRGLVGFRMRFGDKQKKLGVRKSQVGQFAKDNAELVKEAAGFTKLSDTERADIVKRARKLARAGNHGFCEVTRLVAEEVGRAAETIRTLLKKHDQDNPTEPIFPDVTPPIGEENTDQIVQLYRQGKSMREIATHYNRNKSTIHRILYKARAQDLLTKRIKVIPHPDFDKPAYRKKMAGSDVVAQVKSELDQGIQGKFKNPLRNDKSIPTYFKDLFNSKILTREQEGEVFKAFNYYKFRAEEVRKQCKGYTPTAAKIRQLEEFWEKVIELKKFIVASNLRLVVSIAKKHLGPNADFATLISDGNLSLIKACETFDFARGNRFSTYASWAVMKNFARSIPVENYFLKQFQPVEPELIEEARRDEAEEIPHYEYLAELRQGLLSVVNRLDDREKNIIINRFGLNGKDEKSTLEDIGADLKLSKERIRQIEAKALEKIREIIETEEIELMTK